MSAWPKAAGIVLAAGLAAAGLAGPAAGQEAPAPRKKLIATGWDNANTERLRANLAEMEKRPFDGVVLTVEGRVDEKKRCSMGWTFTRDKWQRAWFEPCIADLKACKFTRFTDNFAQVGANPGSVDWFDDAGWAEIIDHWRIAAWVARQGRLKGLLFDPEPYAPPHAQFIYAAQPQHDKHTFDDYVRQARKRGGEVMRAIGHEYPDITLLSYFLNVVVARAADHADPNRALATMHYGLLPAFLDGWLDAAGPGVKLVDGCENAYHYNGEREFLEAAIAIKGPCQYLISPANRPKYRSQVQAGFGIYLDAYWNPKDSKWGAWYVDGLGGPRVERLRINVQTALRVADEYVWVYGEKYRWWPTPNRGVQAESWPQALSGCEDALRYARDPLDYARTKMAEAAAAGRLVNLLRNGDFSQETVELAAGDKVAWKEGRPPAGWSAWQSEKSKGVFSWDCQTDSGGRWHGHLARESQGHPGPASAQAPATAGTAVGITGGTPVPLAPGSARAAGVADGCFLQRVSARPGERYAVRAACRTQGAGQVHLRIRWQTTDEKWTAEARDRVFYPPQAAGRDWQEVLGVAEVPEGAGNLVVLLCITGQPTDQDLAWFDDAGVYKLE